MSTISAADVNALRKRTNAPMMECKAALTEANGDMDQAVDILRKKNSAIQAKKGETGDSGGKNRRLHRPGQTGGSDRRDALRECPGGEE